MAWLRVDDGYDSHPKILALGSDQRRWTWTRILVYTCRYRSPVIPANVSELVPRATPAFLRECVDIGLVDVTDDGTLEVHDWDTYNGSDPKVQVRERVRKHRENRYNGVTDTVTDALPDRYSRVGARARPVPNPLVTTSSTAPKDAHAPDDDPVTRLKAAGWTEARIAVIEGRDQLELANAWLTTALADTTIENPGAYAYTMTETGSPPDQPTKKSTLAKGATGTRSTAPPPPNRTPAPEVQPAPPPPEFLALAGHQEDAA